MRNVTKSSLFSFSESYDNYYEYACDELIDLLNKQINEIDEKHISKMVYDFLEKKLRNVEIEDIGIDVDSEISEIHEEYYYITVFENMKEIEEVFKKDIILFTKDFYVECGFENKNRSEFFDFVVEVFLSNHKIKSAIEEAVQDLFKNKFAIETVVFSELNTSYTNYINKNPIFVAKIKVVNLYNFMLQSYYNNRVLSNLIFSLIKRVVSDLGVLDAKTILDNLSSGYDIYEIDYGDWFHFTCIVNEIPCDLEEIRNLLEEKYHYFADKIPEAVDLVSSYDTHNKRFYNDIFKKVLNDNNKIEILNEIYINSFIDEINDQDYSRKIELIVKRDLLNTTKIIIMNKKAFSGGTLREFAKYSVTKMGNGHFNYDEYCENYIMDSMNLLSMPSVLDGIYTKFYEYFSNIDIDMYELNINLDSSIASIVSEEYYLTVFEKPSDLEELLSDILPIFSDEFKIGCVEKVFGNYENYVNYYIENFLKDEYIEDNITSAFLDSFDKYDVHYRLSYRINSYKAGKKEYGEKPIVYFVLSFTNIYGFIKEHFLKTKEFFYSIMELALSLVSFMAEVSAIIISEFENVEVVYEDFLQFFTDIATTVLDSVPEYSLGQVYELVNETYDKFYNPRDLERGELYNLMRDRKFFTYLLEKAILKADIYRELDNKYINTLIQRLKLIRKTKTKVIIYDKKKNKIYDSRL